MLQLAASKEAWGNPALWAKPSPLPARGAMPLSLSLRDKGRYRMAETARAGSVSPLSGRIAPALPPLAGIAPNILHRQLLAKFAIDAIMSVKPPTRRRQYGNPQYLDAR